MTTKDPEQKPNVASNVDNLRQVSIVIPTMTVHLISSYDKENINYLSAKAIQILEYLRQEEK